MLSTAEHKALILSLSSFGELDAEHLFTEAQIVDRLALRIAQLIAADPEGFFQLMYRLDVPEGKVHEALQTEDPAMAVARLVYLRQLQKVRTRQQFRPSPPAPGDDELEW